MTIAFSTGDIRCATAELKKLQLLPQLSTAVPTTLAPLGFEITAKLLYHGYMQAMATLHLSQGSPLLEPRPTLDDFVDLARGRPRKRRSAVR